MIDPTPNEQAAMAAGGTPPANTSKSSANPTSRR